MIWTMQHHTAWYLHESRSVGECILKHQQERPGEQGVKVSERRGATSAAVLREKLVDFLLANRCQGHGPDSCLPLLHTVVSLGPDNSRLPALIQALEPEFQLADGHSALPALPSNPADPSIIEASQVLTLRQLIFVTAKLPVVIRQPTAWPQDELDQTLHLGRMLNQRLEQIDQLGGRRLSVSSRSFADPLVVIPADEELAPALRQHLQELGKQYAVEPGCTWGTQAEPTSLQGFWLSYVLQKLAQEHTSCGVLQRIGANKLYESAMTNNQTALLQPFIALRPYIDGDGPAHDDVVSALGGSCPVRGSAPDHDPWKVCSAARALFAAAEARENPPPPPPAPREPGQCADTIQDNVLHQLHLDESALRQFACREMPGDAQKSIVALAYLPSSQEYDTSFPDSGDYDLYVLIVNAKDGKIMIRLDQKREFSSDAIQLRSLNIDTGRYQLAPGLRAFGIRADHANNSHVISFGEITLNLYLPRGHKITPILTGLVVNHTSYEQGTDCMLSETQLDATIQIGNSRHKGLADLIIRTREADSEAKVHGENCEEVNQAPVLGKYVLQFDGKTYPLPSSLSSIN